MAAAMALAELISDDELNEDYILPKAFNPIVALLLPRQLQRLQERPALPGFDDMLSV